MPRKSVVWNFVLCSGTIWWHREKFEHGCTTTSHCLYKASKSFLKFAQLNTVSVSTIGGTAFRFWHNLYELNSFCGTMWVSYPLLLFAVGVVNIGVGVVSRASIVVRSMSDKWQLCSPAALGVFTWLLCLSTGISYRSVCLPWVYHLPV